VSSAENETNAENGSLFYFQPETETKTKLLRGFWLKMKTNLQDADEVIVT